jgi:hypothetical protein
MKDLGQSCQRETKNNLCLFIQVFNYAGSNETKCICGTLSKGKSKVKSVPVLLTDHQCMKAHEGVET